MPRNVETVSVHQVENQEQFIKTKAEMYRILNTLEEKTLEDDKLSDEISKAVLSRLGRTIQINIAQKIAGAQISDHSKGYDHTKKSIISSSDIELGECYPQKKEKNKRRNRQTISHIPSGLTPSFTSAPCDFTATCIYDIAVSSESKKLKKEEPLIAEGSFDPEFLPYQTFEVQKFDIE
ncbi:MAG: hypothetical protein EZS28_018871 [Streblomastix strix]|uniref:Uncharacterized protein n=1 Tax=Streblomastix strix TaxID=222440 RepID=A0A5J4VSN4_9EUKA|nr:MAG: hypothetical protein EZS28_018871 [Streblomastix strix]